MKDLSVYLRICDLLEPKFLVAQHSLDETPPRLYWFDLPTMLKLGGMERKGIDDNISNHQHLVLATQVQESNHTERTSHSIRHWPVRPTAEAASEFKISPFVHAGYAITWYSLSAAGVYMTRELLQRAGRR
jgi:cytochrome oxidase assembly protein ShyY1